ncbi:MAG: DUF3078 domain-containing protein [Candidatus Marinimicrobia bacterium]|nr:DUF3078 domain-containing protein [Candidatus Neomarinimicrobiota bacterium]
MKKQLVCLCVLLATVPLLSQEDPVNPWKQGGQGALNFSQTALSNWSGGGMNALSLNSYVNLHSNYARDAITWTNTLELAYGIVNQGGVLQKTDDKIDLASQLGFQAMNQWNVSGLLGFKTQMTPGYSDTLRISAFASPAYLQVASGLEYKPNDDISLLIAPLSGKMTFVLDQQLSDAGAYGVTAGKKVRAEFGGLIRFAFRKTLFENVVFQTKCEIFSNYLNNPQFMDVNWDLMLLMKINKFMSANLSTQLVYDHDYSINVQLKETIGIGLSFSF